MTSPNQPIEALLDEERIFPAPELFKKSAQFIDPSVYSKANQDFQAFWAEAARDLHWIQPWETVLEWNAPFAKWFVGGKLNVSYNCVHRHAKSWRRNKAALIWE